MPRFHAVLGIVSPAKSSGVKASRHTSPKPATNKRANILINFLRLVSLRWDRKTIFYTSLLTKQATIAAPRWSHECVLYNHSAHRDTKTSFPGSNFLLRGLGPNNRTAWFQGCFP